MLVSLSDGIDQDKLLQEAAGWLQVEWCLTTTRLLPIFDEELGWREIMSRRCSQTGVGLRMQALVEEVARRARHRCVAYVVKSGAGVARRARHHRVAYVVKSGEGIPHHASSVVPHRLRAMCASQTSRIETGFKK
jgi:hypothetical protein